jgi:ferredoxin
MCEPECPVNAIVSEDDLPEDQADFLEINEELAAQWPVLTVRKDAPEDADDWEDVSDKRQYLER